MKKETAFLKETDAKNCMFGKLPSTNKKTFGETLHVWKIVLKQVHNIFVKASLKGPYPFTKAVLKGPYPFAKAFLKGPYLFYKPVLRVHILFKGIC